MVGGVSALGALVTAAGCLLLAARGVWRPPLSLLAGLTLACVAVVLAGTAVDAAVRARAEALLAPASATEAARAAGTIPIATTAQDGKPSTATPLPPAGGTPAAQAARQRLTVRITGDPVTAQDVVLIEARLLSSSANGADVLVVLADGAEPREPERGTEFTAWFALSAPAERGPEALRLRPVSAPLGEVSTPEDALTRQRTALTELFSATARDGAWQADGAALVPGMVAGDRSLQSQELSAAMNASGLSHLTAVSGANVAMLLAAVAAACRALRVPRRLVTPLGLACLGVFVLLVGPDPSVARAAVMGALSAVAVVVGRPRTSVALLSAAVALLVAADPWQISRAAFQLSVLACLGIALGSAPLVAGLRRVRVPRLLAESTAVSVAATLACTPVLVGLNPTQSLVTVPVNVLAAPCAALVGTLGPVLLLLAPLGQAWLAPVILPCRLAASAVAGLGTLASSRGPHVSWPEGWQGGLLAVAACWVVPALFGWALYRAVSARWPAPITARTARSTRPHRGLGALTSLRRLGSAAAAPWRTGGGRTAAPGGGAWLHPYVSRVRRRRWWHRTAWAAALLASVGAGLGAAALGGNASDAGGRVMAGDLVLCDVGQGDATLLVGEDGTGVLIDAGPEDGNVVRCLQHAGVSRLCAAVASHLDADHVGGFPAALKVAPAGRVLYGTAGRTFPVDGATRGKEGDRIDCAPWSVAVVSAPQDAGSENDGSLVVRASDTVGTGIDLLAAGDTETDAARAAVARGVASPERAAVRSPGNTVRVLKVSHHGARNGGTALQEAFAPDIALIGVGARNDYGHPHAETIDSLVALGLRIERTDRDGTVVLHPTDHGVAVSTHR